MKQRKGHDNQPQVSIQQYDSTCIRMVKSVDVELISVSLVPCTVFCWFYTLQDLFPTKEEASKQKCKPADRIVWPLIEFL